MSDENRNTITYDEDWQNVSVPEYPVIAEKTEDEAFEDEDSENNERKKKVRTKRNNYPKQYLVTFQLIICLAIALAAFILKGIGGEIYPVVKDWYITQLNSSVIFDSSNEIDFDNIFGAATSDEAKGS